MLEKALEICNFFRVQIPLNLFFFFSFKFSSICSALYGFRGRSLSFFYHFFQTRLAFLVLEFCCSSKYLNVSMLRLSTDLSCQ